MNHDVIQPQRRPGRLSRTIRVLLTVAALTGVGLSLGACNLDEGNGWGSECHDW